MIVPQPQGFRWPVASTTFSGELVWCLSGMTGSGLSSQDRQQAALPESGLASQPQAPLAPVFVVGHSMCPAARVPGFAPAFRRRQRRDLGQVISLSGPPFL